MVIATPTVRKAKAVLAKHRKALKAARPARVIPTVKGQRAPRKRDPGFLAYVRRQGCAVGPIGCDGPTQAAHIRTGLPGEPPTGLQRKPDDSRCTPLCAGHHRQQHAMQEMRFWAQFGKDPFTIAAYLYRQYQECT